MAASYIELSLNQTSRGSSLLTLDSTRKEKTVITDSENFSQDAAGGFIYNKQSKITRNRHIKWRVLENILELTESSLDYNLFGNKVEIVTPGEIILPNVIIQETDEKLCIFFATKHTSHQICLVHPNNGKYGFILPTGMNVSLPSVFNDIETKYTHTKVSLTQPCSNFDITVTREEEIYFGFITDTNSLLVVYQADNEDESTCVELKEASVMHRLWTGLVPSFVRGDSSSLDVESVIMHSFGDDVYALSLCKDLKIRVWDIKNHSCVTTKDLVSFIPDKLDSQADIVGTLKLKKAKSCSSQGHFIMAAYCCFSYSSQFIVLEVFKEKKELMIMNVSNFFSDFNIVQDIALTSQYIWALWNTSDGEYSVTYAPIEGGKDYEQGWHNTFLRNSGKDEVYIPMFQDAKEAYLDHLFAPDTYDKQSIHKALEVITKTVEDGIDYIPDESSDMVSVKESVIQILDLQVEQTSLNRNLSPADYQDIQQQCWTRFYAFIQQCKQAREKPLGLFVDDTNSTALLIRQETCGLFQYMDWLDHLYATNLETCEEVQLFIENELDLEDCAVARDILCILECLKTIPDQFSADVIRGIDNDLDGNEDVKTFLTNMASSLISNTSDFEQLVGDPIVRGDYLTRMEGRMKHLRKPAKAIEIILSALESTEYPTSAIMDQSDMCQSPNETSLQFLCSKDGVEIVSNILSTLSYHRMHFCRDLFVLLKLMDQINCKIGLDLSVAKDLGTTNANSCYELCRSYHTVYWSSRQTYQNIDSSTMDTNLTNLASLRLTERSPSSKTARKTEFEKKDNPVSLLHSFIRDVGIESSLKYLTETNLNSMKPGDYSVTEMTKLVARACLNEIWVLNENSSDFPEYLAAHCQYNILNDYLHLCDEWCMVSRGTKDFLLAQSYLGNDQPEKALRYFISAARGISMQERLLMNLLEGEEGSKQDALVHYFIRVMRLFEQHDYPTFVISSASSAIAIAKKDNPNIPMLWSVIFKNHLELEHYNEAYASIIHNTDRIRRNDCLRHFIITLCEHGLFQEICSYPYVNLEDEVVSIIEARARTMDITVNKYYDLLYSYHIIKNDYRKAATSMYEQACRLRTEMHGLKSLQKQAKCFLASLTSLKLVDSKYAWIVRPQDKNSHLTAQPTEYSQSPKRKGDGEEVYYSSTKKQQKSYKTVIVEMNDLERDYILVLARLKLIQHGKNDTMAVLSSFTATETVGLLSQVGLFDMAFSVAQKFKLSYSTIFEALAGKCATLVNSKVSEFDDRWKWLTLNEISTTQLVCAKTAAQQSYLLLQSYLKKYQTNSSLYLKAVASKFLRTGCALPSWLVKDYELANAAELLHLYLCYDMVKDATQLSLKYIDAVMGVGKEHFGLNTALHATTPAVWLPYTCFDQLLSALRSNYENTEVSQLCDELQSKLNDYFDKLEKVSCDKLEYLHTLKSRSRDIRIM